MGLSISFNCFRASCSTFNDLRCAIARAAGVPVSRRDFGQFLTREWWTLPNEEQYTLDNYAGQWEPGQPEDVLLVLLVHADDDGVIVHRHTGPLADRLEGLLPKIPGREWGLLAAIQPYGMTEHLIRGLRRASAAGCGVKFG